MKPALILCSLCAILTLCISCTQEEKQQQAAATAQPEQAKPIPPPDDLVKKFIDAVKSRNKEQYYSLFPNAEQVATYGVLAYGLKGELEERSFWNRPWPEYVKSVDSLEQLERPRTFTMIGQYFNMLHRQADWEHITIVKTDTVNNRSGDIGNIHEKLKAATLTTDVVIHLAAGDKKFMLHCPNVTYIEGEGWFLKMRYDEPRVEKEN